MNYKYFNGYYPAGLTPHRVEYSEEGEIVEILSFWDGKPEATEEGDLGIEISENAFEDLMKYQQSPETADLQNFEDAVKGRGMYYEDEDMAPCVIFYVPERRQLLSYRYGGDSIYFQNTFSFADARRISQDEYGLMCEKMDKAVEKGFVRLPKEQLLNGSPWEYYEMSEDGSLQIAGKTSAGATTKKELPGYRLSVDEYEQIFKSDDVCHDPIPELRNAPVR